MQDALEKVLTAAVLFVPGRSEAWPYWRHSGS